MRRLTILDLENRATKPIWDSFQSFSVSFLQRRALQLPGTALHTSSGGLCLPHQIGHGGGLECLREVGTAVSAAIQWNVCLLPVWNRAWSVRCSSPGIGWEKSLFTTSGMESASPLLQRSKPSLQIPRLSDTWTTRAFQLLVIWKLASADDHFQKHLQTAARLLPAGFSERALASEILGYPPTDRTTRRESILQCPEDQRFTG